MTGTGRCRRLPQMTSTRSEDQPMTVRHAVLTTFPPLRARKHPGLAALIGAVTGGIGLAIYFNSLRDLFPVELAGGLVVLVSLLAGVEPVQVAQFAMPVVGGLYGFLRARSSNRHRAALSTSAVAVGTAGRGGGPPRGFQVS